MFYRTITSLNQLNLSVTKTKTAPEHEMKQLLEMFQKNKELLYGMPEHSEEKLMYEQLDMTERLILSEIFPGS